MTAKEKAQEIVNKYILYTEKYVDGWIESDLHSAKFCALIAVDEMIVQNGDIYLAMLGDKATDYYIKMNSYLFEVKQEIEKL